MQINSLSKKSSWGKKPKDPFYQSQEWKLTKERFKLAVPHIQLPPINGVKYSNNYCAECWKNGRINDERIEIDHVQEIKDGGNKTAFSNLRALCHAHHTGKTNHESQKRKM